MRFYASGHPTRCTPLRPDVFIEKFATRQLHRGSEIVAFPTGVSPMTKINMRYVLSLASTAALGGLLFGFDVAIISGAGPFIAK